MAGAKDFKIEEVKTKLDELGWAVVENVLSQDTCTRHVNELNTWLKQFDSVFPNNVHSIIHHYNISHIAPAWATRLEAKSVFAELWGTQKLHTSLDGIAIGRPPELSATNFDDGSKGLNQLHLDQGPSKKGLHAFQGAVYLEEQLEDDWTFMVMEKSHKFHQAFFESHKGNNRSEFRKLSKAEIEWYEEQGCERKRLAISKGGMVLWDSRTVHAGAQPFEGRKNPRKWRYVVFVSMTPAIWSRPEDLIEKKECYQTLRVSRHWSSQGFSMFGHCKKHSNNITELPEIAKTEEARLLAGDKDYDFTDGNSNGPNWTPVIN